MPSKLLAVVGATEPKNCSLLMSLSPEKLFGGGGAIESLNWVCEELSGAAADGWDPILYPGTLYSQMILKTILCHLKEYYYSVTPLTSKSLYI